MLFLCFSFSLSFTLSSVDPKTCCASDQTSDQRTDGDGPSVSQLSLRLFPDEVFCLLFYIHRSGLRTYIVMKIICRLSAKANQHFSYELLQKGHKARGVIYRVCLDKTHKKCILLITFLNKLGKYIEVLKCCRVLLDFPLLYLFLHKMKTPKVSSTNRLFIEFIDGIYKSCALLRL